MGSFKLHELKGDLFACPADYSLAHCISADCRMGRGIAVQFKNRFGGIAELKEQIAVGKEIGKVAILERDGRYIYYLITKKVYYSKPTYQSLRESLEEMKDHCLNENVSKIALPKIGCGLDCLEWDKVTQILTEVFSATNVELYVYSL